MYTAPNPSSNREMTQPRNPCDLFVPSALFMFGLVRYRNVVRFFIRIRTDAGKRAPGSCPLMRKLGTTGIVRGSVGSLTEQMHIC